MFFLYVLQRNLSTFIYMISNLYSLTFNTSHVLSAQHTFTKKKVGKLYSFIAPAKSTPIQTQRECIEPLLISLQLHPSTQLFSSFSVFKSNMKKIPFKSTAHRRSKRKLLKTEFKVKFNLKNFSLSFSVFLFHFTRCSNRKREMERKYI